MQLNLPVPVSALAIAAHPDDVEFGAGATLAKWSAAGCVVHHLVCTDGSKGTWDLDADPADLARTRRSEQAAAAARLGATGEVRFLDVVDGELEATRERREQVVRVLRELRPAVVLGHDPWRRWRLHPDHRAAGWLTCDAVVDARDPHFFPDMGLGHHRPDELLLFECGEPDHYEDVTGHEDAKVAALLAHTSQLLPTMGIPDDDDGSARAAFEQKVLDGLSDAGRRVGARSAEAFRRVPGV
jgi:LmbE family N-acetylglucosaminyl deacetylase